MSKRNRKSNRDASDKSDKGGEQSGTGTGTGIGTGRPSPMKPFVERMVGRTEAIYAKASEVALDLEKRGAPLAVVKVANDFVGECEKYREAFYELRVSGWKPVSAEEFDPQAGTKVAINSKNRELYTWIPGVSDGTAALVVARVNEGARPLYLVGTADGASFGYIPKSHLVPR
jgi:hypothetical protein